MPIRPAALALALLASVARPSLALGQGAPTGDGHPSPPPRAPSSRHYVVEKIRLDGLDKTRPSEVRRHLGVEEGELLDDGAVLLARLRLLQLGWFSRVETRVERGSERGRVVLVFSFTERNTLIVSDLIIGSTAPQPIYGGLGLAQGNFLGMGLGLSGAFVYGGSPRDQPLAPARFALRAAFFDPAFTAAGLPLVFGVSGLALHGEELTCGDAACSAYAGRYGSAPRLRYERVGGEVTFGIRPGPFERLLAGYRVERVTSERVAGAARDPGGPGPNVRPGRSLVSALTGMYERDTRDDPFFPTSGTRLALNIVLGSLALGGDYEYSRYLLQLESDHAMPRGHALRLLVAAGAAQGDAPFFDRFYAADFAYFSLGNAVGRALELNFSTDARYDAYLGMLGAEYGVPLWTGTGFFHRGYLALGGRWLYSAARPNAGRTRASRIPFSADVAVRLDTPVGSFNVSMGYALDNIL